MSNPLYISFIWHMHQPYYRDMLSGECSMPWVRLHASKDYLDMVKLLEPFPNIHQTFNLVPSLIEQLEEYLPPAKRTDKFLDLSRKAVSELTDEDKRFILEWFFMANWERMVKPYPRYHDLLAKRGGIVDEEAWPDIMKRFKGQDYLDLQVWFNLSWIDPWLRQQDEQLKRLEAKDSQFTETEKHIVLDKQLEILKKVIPAYKEAAERGQIELTTSPYYHPIVPLICDTKSAHTALPRMVLPEMPFRHPEDARWHLASALESHAARFGKPPVGIWPPEGSVSEDLVRLAIEANIRWIATDEEILWRTLRTTPSPSLLYRPHAIRRKDKSIAIVFRDRELSDLIGFVYSQWQASLAISDFMSRLESIYNQFKTKGHPALVSIILDGENAWEFYLRDGYDFLYGLYEALSKDERFRVATVQEFLNQHPIDNQQSLPEIFAGSWIDGNFATWIGHHEKNIAWNHLATARQDLADSQAPPEQMEKAKKCFFVAEGSDWMWWYGDMHSSAQDEEFDRLFRTHVSNIYRCLGREVPSSLNLPIKTRVVYPAQEPTALIHPIIDGLDTTYYEWLYAGRLDLRKSYAAIHRSDQILRSLLYGFDKSNYYFRLDGNMHLLDDYDSWTVRLDLPDKKLQIVAKKLIRTGQVGASVVGDKMHTIECGFRRTLELAIPQDLLGIKRGESFQLKIGLDRGLEPLERYPSHATFRIQIPVVGFEASVWSA